MRKVQLQLLLFFTPFILVSLFVFLIDPYDLFNISHLVSDKSKKMCLNKSLKVTTRANMLWKTLEFERNPTSSIVLGDSRVYYINDKKWEDRLGEPVYNLSIPGSNFKTIIDLFWMAARTTKLSNVLIQVSFSRYNASVSYDLYGPVNKVVNNPISFFFNSSYVVDSWNVFYFSITQNELLVNKFYKPGDDRWNLSKEFLIRELTEDPYIYPRDIYGEFVKIKEYCKAEKINLTFFVPPDYNDVHYFTKNLGFEEEYGRFLDDFKSLGNFVNLNNGSEFSFKKSNYEDYFHIKHELADTIVSMLLSSGSLKK
jgi:hypothetical protein